MLCSTVPEGTRSCSEILVIQRQKRMHEKEEKGEEEEEMMRI